MYTYIIFFVICTVVSLCMKNFFDNKFSILFSSILSAILTLIVNIVYFSVCYGSMPTKTITSRYRTLNDSVTFEIHDDTTLYLNSSGKKYLLSKMSEIYLSDSNVIDKKREFFDVGNEWVIGDAFIDKSEEKILTLNKKSYELFKSYQDSIEKRKSALQENAEAVQ